MAATLVFASPLSRALSLVADGQPTRLEWPADAAATVEDKLTPSVEVVSEAIGHESVGS